LLPQSLFVCSEGSQPQMGKVTALVAQASDAERVNIFLDGEYAFGLHIDVAAQLQRGQELSPEDIAALQRLDTGERAYGRALNYLSYRPRSEHEVARYLREKDTPEDVIVDVLARLRRAGLVDDLAFARMWVENREASRPKGAWGLRAELRQKHVPDEDIDAAVVGLDPEASALRAAERKAVRLAHLDENTFRSRLLAFLRRRGFGYDVARRVVDRLWNELGATEQPETR
jgi:regulatory protein